MPVPTIFLLNDSGEIVEMADRPYDSEDLLQQLLANYPSILAGDQFGHGAPLKWLPVTREAGVPSLEGGGDRWSLDHLFIDQEGVPTLVEVKRSSDTRIRREVVGQMLDYAANAVLYWPIDTIRQRFEQTCEIDGIEPQERLTEFLAPEEGTESEAVVARFWETVQTNLRAGKVRLVFVADEIPPELRRVVEFLNVQMNPAEVLAIEIRQYVGKGVRTLVPTVIGTAKRDLAAVAVEASVQWNRESFLSALGNRRGPDVAAIAHKIMTWAETHLPLWSWGEGTRYGSYYCGGTHNGKKYYVFSIWTYGRIFMEFKWLDRRVERKELIAELASNLNKIPGIEIGPESLIRMPAFDLMLLREPGAMEMFCAAVETFLDHLRDTKPPA